MTKKNNFFFSKVNFIFFATKKNWGPTKPKSNRPVIVSLPMARVLQRIAETEVVRLGHGLVGERQLTCWKDRERALLERDFFFGWWWRGRCDRHRCHKLIADFDWFGERTVFLHFVVEMRWLRWLGANTEFVNKKKKQKNANELEWREVSNEWNQFR